MKRILIVVLAMVMLLSCAACFDTPDNTETGDTTDESTALSNTTEEITTAGDTTEETTTADDTTEETTTSGDTTEEITESVDSTEETTEPDDSTEETTERTKPEIQVVTIDQYMTEKYGEYEFVRSEPWFEMFRIKNGTVSVFVYKHEELKYGFNLEGVYDYMFTYNWADNGYWQVNADKIEAYYDDLMKPYLKDIGEYALFAYLEQAVMPSELTLDMSWKDALKKYGEFLFPEVFVLVKAPLTDAQKAEIVDKLTADDIKVHLHIGVAPAEDFELNRNYIIPDADKYSDQLNTYINWNGDMPTEEVPQVDGN